MFLDRILALIDVSNGRGLETGALSRPMITRQMGPVEYVDRATREELQTSYGLADDVDAEAIVEVDHVWAGQSLLECVGGARAYDYLLASHVIEHAPDLFGWLREISSVLVDGGVAVFRVPDKRGTFDRARQTSSAGQIVSAYLRGLRGPDAQQIFDCFYNMRDPISETYPDGAPVTDESVTANARHLVELCRGAQVSGEYVDAHCWAFTPASMVDVLDLGSRLDLLPFEILALEQPPEISSEFLLALRRLPETMTAEARRAAFATSRAGLGLRAELREHEGASEALAHEAEHALARLRAMEASTSWRITAPLRRMVEVARRVAGRGGS